MLGLKIFIQIQVRLIMKRFSYYRLLYGMTDEERGLEVGSCWMDEGGDLHKLDGGEKEVEEVRVRAERMMGLFG